MRCMQSFIYLFKNFYYYRYYYYYYNKLCLYAGTRNSHKFKQIATTLLLEQTANFILGSTKYNVQQECLEYFDGFKVEKKSKK